MGLDMYLTARKRLYPEWKQKEDGKNYKDDTSKMKKLRQMFPEMFKLDNLDYIEIGFEAGYWRKSNQIHKWFVDTVQGGSDDCRKYYVDSSELKKLY